MFHVDLLTPYRETEFHGPNYAWPPPDLIGEEEQYEVEQVLDERNYGRWKKKQYLVKWKGYPDSDNQWLDAKDMENAQELIAEFHNLNHELRSCIRRALGHLSTYHPSPPLYHCLLPLNTGLMPLTPPTTPPSSKKIRLHSPFLHARLPQMLPKVQYAYKSKKPRSRSELPDSSGSVKMDLRTSPVSVSHTQTSPPLVSSTTPTKKTYHPQQQFHVLIPPFKRDRKSTRLNSSHVD